MQCNTGSLLAYLEPLPLLPLLSLLLLLLLSLLLLLLLLLSLLDEETFRFRFFLLSSCTEDPRLQSESSKGSYLLFLFELWQRLILAHQPRATLWVE